MSSPYGKVDERDQVMLEARRKSRKRIAIIAVSVAILVGLIIGAVFGLTMAHKKSSTLETKANGDSISVSVKAVCDVTLHKDKCFETVGAAPNASSLNPEQLFIYAVKITMDEVSKALNSFSAEDNITMSACVKLLDLTRDNLNDTLTSSSHGDVTLPELVDDLRTWLSSAATNQETCLETLAESNDEDMKTFGETHLKNSTEMTSNALAIITWLGKIADSMKLRRRLLSTDIAVDFNAGRRLLQSNTDLRKIANIVVAKDGSGKYRTIKRALEDVPEKSDKRTIIYVKSGVYFENVEVGKKMWNVVVVGDGESKSIVSGRLNVIDGTPTFKTATFAVFGKGFMARDMGFINTAGPAKHQAVALMVSADLTAFYRCTMNAFQDTLYVHAQRQFYRDCTIIGTVDFIFGNSASVFQNCRILPRRPMKGQKNTITAQGKKDPNQNTGISIHRCSIEPLGDLKGVETFLGRPWKDYSTTVIMDSFLHGFIDRKGWLPWIGDSAPSTIYYGEYKNNGAGASTKNRVKWKGLKFLSKKEAEKFTVKPFIDGGRWLPATKVPFRSGL